MSEPATKICPAKHTKAQVPDAEWRCPDCGVDVDHVSGGFVIEEPFEGADSDCPKLHDLDGIYCNNCDYSASGKSFVALYAKRKGLVPCSACKGTGLIKEKR